MLQLGNFGRMGEFCIGWDFGYAMRCDAMNEVLGFFPVERHFTYGHETRMMDEKKGKGRVPWIWGVGFHHHHLDD